jgi:uncharacterized protein (DUF488 family)
LRSFSAIPSDSPQVLTVGHSTHEQREFVALLERHGVKCLADVRVHPGSRRLPHFNQEALAGELPERGIDYEHLRALGGRRRPAPDSPNAGWESEAFRGYADHMRSREFWTGLEALERLARAKRTAIMCAEALWWRCHRRLIADALLVRGWHVVHIAADASLSAHELTPFAVVDRDQLSYPPRQVGLDV